MNPHSALLPGAPAGARSGPCRDPWNVTVQVVSPRGTVDGAGDGARGQGAAGLPSGVVRRSGGS